MTPPSDRPIDSQVAIGNQVVPSPDAAGMAQLEDEVFRTDHLVKDLGGRAFSGSFVTAVSQAVRFGLYMASTIVLARLLSKEDFGLVAMVGALTSILRVFREAGLSTATMQKERITHAQVSNLFWINVALGAGAALVGAALAPGVAWFFRDQRLVWITIGLTLTFLFSGSSVQHLALLNRDMRFKALALIDVGATALGAGVGVIMAMTGWGYWSLVASQVAMALAEMVLAWTLSRWRPQLPRARAGTRSMVRFGASLTFSTLLRRLTGGADSLLIGRFWGAEPLGLYSRGMALLMRPLDQLVVPFDIVFIPVLSRLQAQPERYRSTYLQVFGAIALVSFPLAGLLLSLSRPLVLLMLGPRWDQVTPIFAALSVTALYYPVACTTVWLPTTQQRNRDIVVLGVIISSIPVAAYLAGLPFGAAGVAWSFSLSGLLVRWPLQLHIVGRAGAVSRGDLWRAFLTYLPSWAAVAGSVYCTYLLVPSASPAAQILCCTPVGLLAALGVAFLMPAQRIIALKLVRRATEVLSAKFRADRPA